MTPPKLLDLKSGRAEATALAKRLNEKISPARVNDEYKSADFMAQKANVGMYIMRQRLPLSSDGANIDMAC